MQIKQITLKNFRCFSSMSLSLNHPFVLIEGPNGSGKTSLLEALHYLCYLRSFRTYAPRDMVQFEAPHFFIKIELESSDATTYELQAGFTGKKRVVKLNQKAIQSFKELMDYYRVITLTEDDLTLIKGGPDIRRAFIDQALVLFKPEISQSLRTFRSIAEQRNAVLLQGGTKESYDLWTQRLWEHSQQIQDERRALLRQLENRTNQLLADHFGSQITVHFGYEAKHCKPGQSYDDFLSENMTFAQEEWRLRRSLFGAHLDDFSIQFCERKSKIYASRGQQKLITVLLKIAQMSELMSTADHAIFLLDDFMTDFDDITVETLITILTGLSCQLIFTCPVQKSNVEEMLVAKGVQRVKLTHRIVAP